MSTLYQDADVRRRTVLVAVMNNAQDFRRATCEGWYRIPQRRAPRRLAADYLAFYQTGAFRDHQEAHTITFIAPIHRYRLLPRCEILANEPDHPRAQEYYFKIEIGPLERLPRPVPSATLRRLTFIHTTMRRLAAAQDLRELFVQDDPVEQLWQRLREERLRPLKNRLVNDWPMDIALRARGGYLGISCSDRPSSVEETPQLHERWEFLTFSEEQLLLTLDSCLRQIGRALLNLGGSDLR